MASVSKQLSGLVVVDHGSRKPESNQRLLAFVDLYRSLTDYLVVEPAHMELASPTILDAFRACSERGAHQVIVCPFFLLPGRHWQQDIPRLSREASDQLGGIPFLVTSPIGVHSKLVEVLESRIDHCLEADQNGLCDSCSEENNCQTHSRWICD